MHRKKEIFDRKEKEVQKLNLETLNCVEHIERYAGKEHYFRQIGWGSLAAFVSFCILIATFFFTQETILIFISIAPLLMSIGLFGWWLYIALAHASLQKRITRLYHQSATLGMKEDSIDGILEDIQIFNEELDKVKIAYQDIETSIKVAEEQLKENQENIRLLRNQKEGTEKTINLIIDRTEVSDLRSYTTKLKLKNEAERQRDIEESILKSAIGDEESKNGNSLDYWRIKLGGLAEFKDEAVGVKYDKIEVKNLKGESSDLDESISNINAQLAEFRSDFNNIAQKAITTWRPDEVILCETSRELIELKNRLSDFIEEVEGIKENAKKAIEIFEKIGAEEEENVAKLFGPESPASIKFEKITGGIYKSVEYDQENRRLWTHTQEHHSLSPDQLSKGTYDQLYLSIRLAMADNLLMNEPGFLILDDPFLASDSERLLNQIDILRSLVVEGWQIIYFSVKDEIYNALENDINSEAVILHKLQSIHQMPA